jgi:glycosyltransferase involved in cell wall biosynthesis
VKRVLIPVYWMTDFGGLHENVLDTAEGLVAGGWQATIMAPPSKAGLRFIAAGIDVLDDRMADIAASVALALSHGPFDLVHAHPFEARRVGVAVAEALGIPLVVTIHGQYDDEFEQYRSVVQQIICVSPHVADDVARRQPRLADRLVVIPNGVDFATFAPRGGRRDTRRTTIAIASRLDPDKGVLSQAIGDLVDHLAETGSPGQYELRVAGERLYGPSANPMTDAIDRAAASAAVEVVRVGWLSERPALREFLADADVVVAPGRAAMEAIACATPTIAAASRGYIGLVTARTLALAHATNFGGVQEAATAYSPGDIVDDFNRALLMTRAETANLRQDLLKLHDIRSIQAAHLALSNRLFTSVGQRKR